MVNLARGFAERGLRVDMVLVRARGVYTAAVPRAVRVVDLRASSVTASLPALFRYLRCARPEVVLSTLGTANVVAILAARLSGVPTRIVVRQALTPRTDAHGLRRRMATLVLALQGRLYRWADAVIAVSEGVAGDIAKATGLPPQRIRVAPNPVVTPELVAMAAERPAHPWFRPGQEPVILAAGRLTTQKNFPSLIRAFKAVRQACGARLVILGEGEDRPALAGLVRALSLEDCVSLPGFVANPFAYMARAAAFVLSSDWEGLPGVLIQALACGTPVIATDCHSGPREVLRGGRFGRLVPPGDTAALGQAIVETLRQPRPVIPEEAWRPFSQDAAVDAYLRILQPGRGQQAPSAPRAASIAAPEDLHA